MTDKTNSEPAREGESFNAKNWLVEFQESGGSVFYGDNTWNFGWTEHGNEQAEQAAELYRSLTPQERATVTAHLGLYPIVDAEALCTLAEAWADRWCALGGSFTRTFKPDGSVKSICRGIPMSYTWEPPTWEEASDANHSLRPHELITNREHFDGAQKMLDSFLTMVPGLREAVSELGKDMVELAGGYAGPETIRKALALRREERAVMEQGA